MNIDPEQAFRLPVEFVIPIEQLFGENEEETQLLRSMAAQAEAYLSGFAWCQSIKAKYFGAGVGQVLAVFLFNIVPSQANADEWVWVVVGDIPPAYLVIDDCKTPSSALVAYIREMRRWIQLAMLGRTSSEVIPVNAPATAEWARKLEKRMNFLQENILPRFQEDEIERA
jgi:hypothetical protein